MGKTEYKLLIADDEYWTREKIRTMVNWEAYSITFMKPAENGEEVLLRLPQEQPDILITDINMPFVNGVELVKKIKESYPDVVVLVLSGYDDFQYVKETLMAGAINYLLKPVAKVDLVHAVSGALEIISKREKDREQILKTASMIQDRELSMLVEKEQAPFAPTLLLEDGQGMAGCSVILIKIHEFQRYMEEYRYDMNRLSYHMKQRIRAAAGLDRLLIFNYVFRSNEFLIATEQDTEEQKRMAGRILADFEKEGKSPVTIALSEHAYTTESIHSAYVQCISALMTRPFSRESRVIVCSREEQNAHRKVESRLSEENEMQMRSLLKSGNGKALKELMLDGIGLRRCMDERWGYLEVRQTVRRLCNLLLADALKAGEAQLSQEIENLADMADKAVERLDSAMLCENLTEIVDTMRSERRSDPASTSREIVRSAAAYIDRNYFEELTLASLSETYNMESSYFSRMFKQETGKNLMLYIAEKRIEKAKEYMRNTDSNLTEIAFLTGYDDYAYFSRVFKKMTGQSPRSYRSACRPEPKAQ